MGFTSRMFGRPDDLARVLALVVEAWRANGARTPLRVGDLYWRRHRSPVNPGERIRLWKDEKGELLGLALFDPPGSCDTLVLPRAPPDEPGDAMLDWAEGECRRRNPASAAP